MRSWVRGVASTFDVSVFQWVIGHRLPVLNLLFSPLSHFGGFVWVGIAVGLGLLKRRRWAGIYQAALGIGLAVLLADAVAKPLISRQRPYADFRDVVLLAGLQRSGSFPSTHAAGSFAGAYALSRVYPEFAAGLWLLAGLVACARVYVGVHFPFDVIGGAIIGLLASAFVIGGTRWLDQDSDPSRLRAKE